MPDLQITMANHISASAAQSALSIQELVTTMKTAGMADTAIRQTLLNDLNTGGPLFGSFRNKLKNTVKNGVEASSNGSANGKFTKAGVSQFQWVSVTDGKVCPDCEERHGTTGTMEYFETIGLPASGFSVCTTNCRCQLLPENYKGENLDKPLVKEKRKTLSILDLKMAGKHKTVADSTKWIEANIAKKVTFKQITDISVANQITSSLNTVYKKYKIKKLDSIVVSRRGTRPASGNGGELSLNSKHFTKDGLKKIYRDNVAEYGKEWGDHLSDLRQKLKVALSEGQGGGMYVELLEEKIKKAEKRVANMNVNKRWITVSKNNTGSSIINHELGHVIHDQFTGKINGRYFMKDKSITDEIRKKWNNEWDGIFRKVKGDNSIRVISEYASADNMELFAESFAMYIGGEKSKLPLIIKNYLDRYLKEFA